VTGDENTLAAMTMSRRSEIHSKFSAVHNSRGQPSRSPQSKYPKSSPNLRGLYHRQLVEDEDEEGSGSEGTIVEASPSRSNPPTVDASAIQEQARILKVKAELVILKHLAADLDTHLQHISELRQIRDFVEKLSAAILPNLMKSRHDRSESSLANVMTTLEDVRQLSQQTMRDETRYVVSVSAKMDRLIAGSAPPTPGRGS
jgi:hypothetical protein